MASGISANTETEQAKPPESLPEDVRQHLSMEQEDELDELQAKHDRVIERRQSLEASLETINAAKDDEKAELDRLDDLQQQDPEAAARSRVLLADQIRHDDIGRDKAAITEAIHSTEAQQAQLEETMEAVYAGGSASEEPDDDADDDEHSPGQVDDGGRSPDGDYGSHGGRSPDRDYGSHEDGGYDGDHGSHDDDRCDSHGGGYDSHEGGGDYFDDGPY